MSSIYNNYFLSEKIKVFPCAYRNSEYDVTARLNTEYNFTHLPHTIDKASYIIEFTSKKLICAIKGYYFEIELDDSDPENKDSVNLENKYLNIYVASPNGAGSIESPHLCSWESINIEDTLDITKGSNTFFAGLKISSGEALSKNTYQCYALKLDASARLPISASKIDNNAGTPISSSFTTGTLSATTSLNVAYGKFTVNSDSITSNIPVIIKKTLDVNTGSTSSTSILKANSTEVTINKPTTVNNTLDVKTGTTSILKAESTREGKKVTINGTTTIKGTTKIQNSSSGVNDGNLTVAGTGGFGDKLTVSSNGASITGNTTIDGTTNITGKTTIGTIGTDTKTEIDNDTVTTSKIIAGNLVIDKNATNDNKILEIKNKAGNEVIFSVNISSGKTFAKEIDADKINATVEGESKNAVDAKNVTDTIKGKAITSIFESNGLVAQKASSLTAASSTNSAGNVIVVGNTNGTVDALIPAKTEGRTYNIGSRNQTFDNIYAAKFYGDLDGNASTATSATYANYFSSGTTVKLTGNITGESSSSTKGWTVDTTIANNAVTKTKIKDGEVTNDKLAGGITNDKLAGGITNDKLVYNSITIGSTEVGLGGSVGDHESHRIGTLYGTSLNLSGNMAVSNIGNIKVNNAGLKSSSLVRVNTNKVYLGSPNYGAAIDSTETDATFIINSAKTSGDMLQIKRLLNSGASVKKVFSVDYEGNITANTYNATSDRRLKENIIDYKPEKSILDLPVKKFDFIDGPKNQIGCIAQDLKEICPEIVNENEKGYLSIQENKLVYLLLDEVKKLKNEVEKLKNK